jgi:hypothetical protein
MWWPIHKGATHAMVVLCCHVCWLHIACACRCPNPAACKHNTTYLATHHPDSNNAQLMSWASYSMQLCDYSEGYQGILCGVCSRGFGQTAPFKCNRCIGFDSWILHDSSAAAVPQPGPARISGLYFVYWLVLTCWLLLCVRFSAAAPKQLCTSRPAGQVILQECHCAVTKGHQQRRQRTRPAAAATSSGCVPSGHILFGFTTQETQEQVVGHYQGE